MTNKQGSQPNEGCLYALLHAKAEFHDRLLIEFVAPVVHSIEESPQLHSYFVARFSEPDWQLRFRVLGDRDWVDGPVRSEIEARLPEFVREGLVARHEFSEYQREWDRYGGQRGMRWCEQLFTHDTRLCLRLLELEHTGNLPKSRREISLLYVERFLDLFDLATQDRADLYRFAHSWPIKHGEWGEPELAALDRKFATVADELQRSLTALDAAEQWPWGNAEVADAVHEALERSRPAARALLELHRQGELESEFLHLVWSLTHMHCNRWGIDAYAESIVRYFGWCLYRERVP